MGERRVFSKAFKEEAVSLAQTSGRTQTEIAKDLGIEVNMLCRWKRESARAVKDKNLTVFPGHGNAQDEEVAQLRKEVAGITHGSEVKRAGSDKRMRNYSRVSSRYSRSIKAVMGALEYGGN